MENDGNNEEEEVLPSPAQSVDAPMFLLASCRLLTARSGCSLLASFVCGFHCKARWGRKAEVDAAEEEEEGWRCVVLC